MTSVMSTASRAWAAMTVDVRDREAWSAIAQWPGDDTGSVTHDGIDFAHATRWFLWDKVGRAIRSSLPSGASEAEWRSDDVSSAAPATVGKRIGLGSRLRSRVLRGRLAAQRFSGRRRVLFCPFPYSRHARILDPLIEGEREYDVVVPEVYATSWPGTIGVTSADPARVKDVGFAERLHARMISGLAKGGVTLSAKDVDTLKLQLQDYTARAAAAAQDLDRLRPDAVLVPSDNTPPFSAVTHAARSRQTPVIMLQHGMDCERYYLDDAYASHIASWGAYRRERYAEDSTFSPIEIRDVGNPHYDALSGTGAGRNAVPGRWLWVTRPHVSDKCYAPSRRVNEGLRIFDALADALDTCPGTELLIKCHPFDYTGRYEALIAERGLSNRIRVVTGAIMELLAQAQIVISEDSTAGLDAMLLGKPLVHAHFAESEPVMPFTKEGAALPGFSPDTLVEALRAATQMTSNDLSMMQSKQIEFLDYAAGPRDGHAAERFAEFVTDVIG